MAGSRRPVDEAFSSVLLLFPSTLAESLSARTRASDEPMLYWWLFGNVGDAAQGPPYLLQVVSVEARLEGDRSPLPVVSSTAHRGKLMCFGVLRTMRLGSKGSELPISMPVMRGSVLDSVKFVYSMCLMEMTFDANLQQLLPVSFPATFTCSVILYQTDLSPEIAAGALYQQFPALSCLTGVAVECEEGEANEVKHDDEASRHNQYQRQKQRQQHELSWADLCTQHLLTHDSHSKERHLSTLSSPQAHHPQRNQQHQHHQQPNVIHTATTAKSCIHRMQLLLVYLFLYVMYIPSHLLLLFLKCMSGCLAYLTVPLLSWLGWDNPSAVLRRWVARLCITPSPYLPLSITQNASIMALNRLATKTEEGKAIDPDSEPIASSSSSTSTSTSTSSVPSPASSSSLSPPTPPSLPFCYLSSLATFPLRLVVESHTIRALLSRIYALMVWSREASSSSTPIVSSSSSSPSSSSTPTVTRKASTSVASSSRLARMVIFTSLPLSLFIDLLAGWSIRTHLFPSLLSSAYSFTSNISPSEVREVNHWIAEASPGGVKINVVVAYVIGLLCSETFPDSTISHAAAATADDAASAYRGYISQWVDTTMWGSVMMQQYFTPLMLFASYFGFTIFAAVALDVIRIMTIHVTWFYTITKCLFKWGLQACGSHLSLFFARRALQSPSLERIVIATFRFAFFIFLMPSLSVYYLFSCSLWIRPMLLRLALGCGASVLEAFPYTTVILRLICPAIFTNKPTIADGATTSTRHNPQSSSLSFVSHQQFPNSPPVSLLTLSSSGHTPWLTILDPVRCLMSNILRCYPPKQLVSQLLLGQS